MLEDLMNLNKSIEDTIKSELKTFNISYGQYKVLKQIYMSQNNKINANKLSLQLNIDKRTLSLNIKKLELLNYIQRIDIQKDKRKKYISLTDLALDMLDDILCIEQQIEEVIKSSLENEQQFTHQIKQIQNNLIND